MIGFKSLIVGLFLAHVAVADLDLSDNVFIQHMISNRAAPFSAPTYLPPDQNLVCHGGDVCVQASECVNGYFSAELAYTKRTCDSNTEICCRYKPKPTPVPSIPCTSAAFDCISPNQCVHGEINIKGYSHKVADQCFAPEVCCRIPVESTVLEKDGYHVRVPEIPFIVEPTPSVYVPSSPVPTQYVPPRSPAPTQYVPVTQPPVYLPPVTPAPVHPTQQVYVPHPQPPAPHVPHPQPPTPHVPHPQPPKPHVTRPQPPTPHVPRPQPPTPHVPHPQPPVYLPPATPTAHVPRPQPPTPHVPHHQPPAPHVPHPQPTVYLPPATPAPVRPTPTVYVPPRSPAPTPYAPQPQPTVHLPPATLRPSNPRPIVVVPSQPHRPNVPQQYLPPQRPTHQRGEDLLSEPIYPKPKPTQIYLPPTPNQRGENILSEPIFPQVRSPQSCAAALKCTPIEFCTKQGVISKTPVILTPNQELFRAPLTDCADASSGIQEGKCCRDPDYVDPWPTSLLLTGQYDPTLFQK